MAKISGHGGFWVLAGTPNVVVHNAEYELDVESINDDVTTSGSVGFVEGLPIISKFNSGVMRFPDDDTQFLEVIGLEEGAVADIWFKRGAFNVYDKVTGTIVRGVRIVNHQQQARRCEVMLEYGSFARAVTAPVIS